MDKKLLCIMGPTAVGKTAVSVLLAEKLGSEILSADSMQIYRELNIGTAKISQEEMHGIKHHFIDIISPDQPFSGFDFGEKATDIIEGMFKTGTTPIVVGGTGFYFDSLLFPLSYDDKGKDEVRKKLNEQLNLFGPEYLYEKLKEIDPESAEKIHSHNVVRVMRALEIFYITGNKKSQHKLPAKPKYEATLFVLNLPREILYDKINERVDRMFDRGLVEEVEKLSKIYLRDCQCFSAIGYKEILEYLDGKISLDESREKIKQNSRNYAKRQLSYFKRFKDAIWLDCDKRTPQEISTKILETFLNGQ